MVVRRVRASRARAATIPTSTVLGVVALPTDRAESGLSTDGPFGPVKPKFCPFCGDEVTWTTTKAPTGGTGQYRVYCRVVEPRCGAYADAFILMEDRRHE